MEKKSWIILLVGVLLALPGSYSQPPAGYYNSAFGKKKDALKTALKEIIYPHEVRTYSNLWTDFESTDNKGNNVVWDMYSDIPGGSPRYIYYFGSDDQCGSYTKEGSCYNREHSFPKSWFNDASPMYTDLFHLYPTDGYVNGKRGNDPFGEVGNADWTSTNGSKSGSSSFPGYTGKVFEPIDAYKGDFARTYFYMVTCYEDKLSSWSSPMLSGNKYPAFTSWALDLLLKWSRNDAVSKKEYDRNNAVYRIQQNRNPYIDYPQLAEYVWGDSIQYAFNPGSVPGEPTDPVDPTDPTDPSPSEYLIDFSGPWNKLPGYMQTNSSETYSSGESLAFKSTGKYLIVSLKEDPDKLSFDMKAYNAWGNNDNHLYVSESVDGQNYEMIRDIDNKFLTTADTTNSGNIQLKRSTRYVKLEYAKVSQNIGISNIKISGYHSSGTETVLPDSPVLVYSWQGVLYVANSSPGSVISVYSVYGQLLSQSISSSDVYTVRLPESDLIIVRITDSRGYGNSYKIRNK